MFVTEKLKTFSWVNVGNPDHEDFEKLQTEYKIDEDTISDILDPDEQPRLEIEDDYKVIIVRFPIINRETDTLWHTEPLSIIYSASRVITVCRKRCDLLDRIKKSEKTSREEFILNIIYYIAESYLRMLKELNIDWSWWLVLLPEIVAITFYLSVIVITVLSVRSERRSFIRLYEKERKRMNRF